MKRSSSISKRMATVCARITLAAYILFPVGLQAQPSPGSSGAPLDCMIQPHEIVQVGIASPGVINRILVDRGDTVTAGEPIALLDDSVERAAYAVARERARQVGETTIATSSQILAQRELERASELYNGKFVSQPYLDKRKAEARAASGQSAKAREKRRLALKELELALARLEQKTIRAPISGVVVERYLSPGEYADQKPVMRVASIDPLRVDVLVPASAFGRVASGSTVPVTPEFGDTPTAKPYQATVAAVDRVIDPASNTFRVRLTLPNPGAKLPAGLRCRVDLGLAAQAPSPAGSGARPGNLYFSEPVKPASPRG